MWIYVLLLTVTSLVFCQYDGTLPETNEAGYEAAEKVQPRPYPISAVSSNQLSYTAEQIATKKSPAELIALIQSLLDKLRGRLQYAPQGSDLVAQYDAALADFSPPPPGVQSDFIGSIGGYISLFTKVLGIFSKVASFVGPFLDSPGAVDQSGNDEIVAMIADINSGIQSQVDEANGPSGAQSDFISSFGQYINLANRLIGLFSNLAAALKKIGFLDQPSMPRPVPAPIDGPPPVAEAKVASNVAVGGKVR
ncbi:hypothetical protein RB195_021304 [Necator americanus]|uniref:Secreted protein n=1 Tax=Necator americanus TaxID=51031 RepID=A0ABR1ECZ5_NECAM